MNRAAVLFDLDGVLIDVSASYRAAIRETAEYFTGDEVTAEEIRGTRTGGASMTIGI